MVSEPGDCRRASINITLPHPQGTALFWSDANDVYTCARGGGPPRSGLPPSLRDATGRSKPARHLSGFGPGRGFAGLGSLRRFITGPKAQPPLYPPLPHTHPRTLFCRLSAGLIRADMRSVLGWTDIAITGVCVCVRARWSRGRVEGSQRRVLCYKQPSEGIRQQMSYAILPKGPSTRLCNDRQMIT